MSSLVYFDLQDGNGFRDVSSLIKYDSLTIDMRACADNRHYAQNTASFDLVYDPVLFPLLQANAADIIVKIFHDIPSYPMFYGHIPRTRVYTYNGILNNIVMSLEAIDDGDYLDKSLEGIVTGGVCYRYYQVMNPASPSISIVHQLAYLAGFTFAQIGNTVISEVLNAFVPPSTTDTIKDLLDALLFEYGYTLHFDENGLLSPIKWISAIDSTLQFIDSNIIGELGVSDSFRTYRGAEVTYYELAEKTNVLLYMDKDLPYADTFGFLGYPIPNGHTYPPTTNVIDETTGLYTKTYQVYEDTAIKYWTNAAIKQNLDYNYKAFTSDFSSMVATYDWVLTYQADANVLLDVSEFYNTQARIVYRSIGATDNNLYFSNVYGTVLYKTTERTSKVEAIANSIDIDKYVSTFIFDKVYADILVKAMAAQYNVPQKTYTAKSLLYVDIGLLVDVVTGDSTSAICQVISRRYNESTQIFEYVLRCYSDASPSLSSQTLTYASIAAISSEVMIQLSTIANDGTITPQEKPIMAQQWANINGNGVSSGSYWTTRILALSAGIDTISIDYAYGVLYGYLLTSPGVLVVSTWKYNIAITSSLFYTAWSNYYMAEAQMMATISKYGSFGSVLKMDCGDWANAASDFAPELNCGYLSVDEDEPGVWECGVYSGVADSSIDCSVYDGSISFDIVDCGSYYLSSETDAKAYVELFIDCGVFGEF